MSNIYKIDTKIKRTAGESKESIGLSYTWECADVVDALEHMLGVIKDKPGIRGKLWEYLDIHISEARAGTLVSEGFSLERES